jgi:hypothetical protein
LCRRERCGRGEGIEQNSPRRVEGGGGETVGEWSPDKSKGSVAQGARLRHEREGGVATIEELEQRAAEIERREREGLSKLVAAIRDVAVELPAASAFGPRLARLAGRLDDLAQADRSWRWPWASLVLSNEIELLEDEFDSTNPELAEGCSA